MLLVSSTRRQLPDAFSLDPYNVSRTAKGSGVDVGSNLGVMSVSGWACKVFQ